MEKITVATGLGTYTDIYKIQDPTSAVRAVMVNATVVEGLILYGSIRLPYKDDAPDLIITEQQKKLGQKTEEQRAEAHIDKSVFSNKIHTALAKHDLPQGEHLVVLYAGPASMKAPDENDIDTFRSAVMHKLARVQNSEIIKNSTEIKQIVADIPKTAGISETMRDKNIEIDARTNGRG